MLDAPIGQQPFQTGMSPVLPVAMTIENPEDCLQRGEQLADRNEFLEYLRRFWCSAQASAHHDVKTALVILACCPDTDVSHQRADMVMGATFKCDFDLARHALEIGVFPEIPVHPQRKRSHVENLVGRHTRQRATNHAAHDIPAGVRGGQSHLRQPAQKIHHLSGGYSGNLDALAGGQVRSLFPAGRGSQRRHSFQLVSGQNASRDTDAHDVASRLPPHTVNAVAYADSLGLVGETRFGFTAQSLFQ